MKVIKPPVTQIGVTLIETMLVLALIAVFVIAIGKQYYQAKQQSNLDALQQQITLLTQGLNSYFYQHCRTDFSSEDFNFSPSIKNLVDSTNLKREDAKRLKDPFGSSNVIDDFLLKITPTSAQTSVPYQLQVTVDFSRIRSKDDEENNSLLSWYAKRLGASSKIVDRRHYALVWLSSPRFEQRQTESGLWIMSSNLLNFSRTHLGSTIQYCSPIAESE